jgi:hypothetical protein
VKANRPRPAISKALADRKIKRRWIDRIEAEMMMLWAM